MNEPIKKEEKNYDRVKSFAENMVSFGLGMLIMYGAYNFSNVLSTVPKFKEIEKDYVNPNELEIIVKDLDDNGVDETYFNYGGKSYLLKLYEDKPEIINYKIEPKKVVPLE